jgi:hypothetical protein
MTVVLADTEDTWGELFRAAGAQYTPPRLRLYDAGQPSGCGSTSAEAGPFYCPADRRVYIDPVFFRELERRFGAPGDFAQAYVLAHEVGHHVQTLIGTAEKVHAAQQRATEQEQNALQVRMELQGALRAALAQSAGIRRSGRSTGCCCGSRRRHDPEARAGLCGAGELHAWQRGAAPALVHPRPGQRPDQRLRHLRRARALVLRAPHRAAITTS